MRTCLPQNLIHWETEFHDRTAQNHGQHNSGCLPCVCAKAAKPMQTRKIIAFYEDDTNTHVCTHTEFLYGSYAHGNAWNKHMCACTIVNMYLGNNNNNNKTSDIDSLTRQDDTMCIRNTMLVVIISDRRGYHQQQCRCH